MDSSHRLARRRRRARRHHCHHGRRRGGRDLSGADRLRRAAADAAVCNLAALMPAAMLAALVRPLAIAAVQPRLRRHDPRLDHRRRRRRSLLLLTPQRMFALLVPVLLGFATVLFAFAERISNWLRARAAGRGHEITFNVASLKVLLPVSFYGGYFGAGVGILMLGVFSLATGGDYRSANVAKNFVASLNGAGRHRDLRRARRGALAADAGADGRHHRRRPDRRCSSRASSRAMSCACLVVWSARCAHCGLRMALLVLTMPVLELLGLHLVRQFHHARGHRAVGIGERIDDGEMVGAGDFLVARLAPCPAARLPRSAWLWRRNSLNSSAAHHGVERAAGRHAPVERRARVARSRRRAAGPG